MPKKFFGKALSVLTAMLILISATAGCAKEETAGKTDGTSGTTARSTAASTTAGITTAPAVVTNVSDNSVWYHYQVINILLIGYDYGSKNQPYPRSDSMIILSLNKLNKRISIVSLSRAAYVTIPGHRSTRLNAAHAYGGPELLVKTIELNYKIRIDNYISIGFDSFTKIINALGGIDVSLTAKELGSLNKNEGLNISRGPGVYRLNGTLALAYSRMRSIDNDKARTGRQRTVLKKIAEKVKSLSLSQAVNFLDEFYPLVHTDFTEKELALQAAEGLSYIKYPIATAMIPEAAPLVMRNGYQVLLLNWPQERHRLHSILYPGITPQ